MLQDEIILLKKEFIWTHTTYHIYDLAVDLPYLVCIPLVDCSSDIPQMLLKKQLKTNKQKECQHTLNTYERKQSEFAFSTIIIISFDLMRLKQF